MDIEVVFVNYISTVCLPEYDFCEKVLGKPQEDFSDVFNLYFLSHLIPYNAPSLRTCNLECWRGLGFFPPTAALSNKFPEVNEETENSVM